MKRPLFLVLLAIALLPSLVTAQASASRAVTAPEPVVRAGDVLRIRVWPVADLGGEFMVDASGKVHLPSVGEFRVGDLGLATVEHQLRARYADVLKEAVVSVTPVFAIPVFGAVGAPGVYEADPTTTVMAMLARAGGPTDRANMQELRIIRAGSVLRFNAAAVLESGIEPAIRLQSGDRIVLPVRRRFDWQQAASVLQLVGTVILLTRQ